MMGVVAEILPRERGERESVLNLVRVSVKESVLGPVKGSVPNPIGIDVKENVPFPEGNENSLLGIMPYLGTDLFQDLIPNMVLIIGGIITADISYGVRIRVLGIVQIFAFPDIGNGIIGMVAGFGFRVIAMTPDIASGRGFISGLKCIR